MDVLVGSTYSEDVGRLVSLNRANNARHELMIA